MKPPRQAVTILIHKDGAVSSRSFRIPLWLVRTILIGGSGLFGLLVSVLALYAPIVGLAARVPHLNSEIARLRAENAQIERLRIEVDSLESQYAKVRGMLGADIPSQNTDERLPSAPTITVSGRPPRTGDAGIPVRWPLDESGYVTRGQLGAADDPTHAGTDIAVPTGTPVRAAGSGTVVEAATDPEYGMYVLIRHAGGFTTRYAHLSRILTTAGADVPVGAVIGLSGNSGRSSAPHLHFEIRQKGQSIDPLSQIQEGH